MFKRMILMLVAAVLLISVLGFVKFRQIQAATQTQSMMQPPPTAVTTIVAQRQEWPATLNVIGTMEAVQGVTVSADLPGAIERINFDSGKQVHQGDVLVELDTRQERAQLADVEAQSELARINFERNRQLLNAGVISRLDYDRAVADQKQTEARVNEIHATIQRKTIRAPFSGVLGIRKVNLGQYLSAGDAVVPLQALNPIYVNFGVPQQSSGEVRTGRSIHITTEGLKGQEFAGRVTAMDAVVDATTRNVQVQATLANPQGKLHPGMFVNVKVTLGQSR